MRKQISFSGRYEVGHTLREARVAQGLTQRALGNRVGLPQSHISKIEQGVVDLQFSSLSELARALDLELKLIPRRALPAVEGVIGTLAPASAEASTRAAHALLYPLERLARSIGERYPFIDGVAGFLRILYELRALPFDTASQQALRSIAARAHSLETLIEEGPRALEPALDRMTNKLRALRNARVHGASPPSQIPAHGLEDDEDD